MLWPKSSILIIVIHGNNQCIAMANSNDMCSLSFWLVIRRLGVGCSGTTITLSTKAVFFKTRSTLVILGIKRPRFCRSSWHWPSCKTSKLQPRRWRPLWSSPVVVWTSSKRRRCLHWHSMSKGLLPNWHYKLSTLTSIVKIGVSLFKGWKERRTTMRM